MWHATQPQTSTHPTHPPVTPTANQSLAKHNRKPSQLFENNHQRSKSIASFCRNLSAPPPHRTNHRSRIAPLLFDTNKAHKIIIPLSALLKTNEKQFSIRYKFTSRDVGNLALLPGSRNVPQFQRNANAACLALLVVLTCPAAWSQIGWSARTETSATATGA